MGDVMVLQASSHVITSLVRVLFSVLDRIVYGLLVIIYNLFTEIAKIDIFGNNDIGDLGRRIYTIIGVLILFKLAISVITYIIDPDKLSDSKKGFTSIIKNVVIMFVMILAVPIVFRYAMILQQAILDDDTIGRLITGKYGATSQSVGPKMATSILAGFVRPNDDVVGDLCDTIIPSTNCIEKLNSLSSGMGTDYNNAITNNDYKKLIDLAASNNKTNGEYIISYSWLISTLVGGFTAYILLLFCIDIATRTAKLAFLQMIAPIPIVTYIDDGGQGMFKKWTKECTNTYLSLFVRLAGIYFAVYLITTFILNVDLKVCSFNDPGCTNPHTPSPLAIIFLILGTLMFAKQLPKLIEGITGLKLDGDFTLNPMKKLSSVPLLGGAAAAGAGLAGTGALAAGRLGFGAVKGLGAGAVSAIKGNGFGSGWKSSTSTDVARAGMRMKSGLQAAGGTWSNWRGDGKYKSGGETYKSLTENYKKGTQQFKDIHKNWEAGKKAQDALNKLGPNPTTGKTGFDRLDGNDKAAYNKVYNHEEFINSLMKMDAQDAKNKEYINALYAAQTGATTVTAGGITYGNGLGAGHELSDLKSDAEKSQKTLTGLEKVHDTMRLKYTDDAKTQDNIKTKKYNPVDPTL